MREAGPDTGPLVDVFVGRCALWLFSNSPFYCLACCSAISQPRVCRPTEHEWSRLLTLLCWSAAFEEESHSIEKIIRKQTQHFTERQCLLISRSCSRWTVVCGNWIMDEEIIQVDSSFFPLNRFKTRQWKACWVYFLTHLCLFHMVCQKK